MSSKVLVSLLLAGAASPFAALADNAVKFDGAIGVVPVSSISATGVVTRNVVRSVQPSAQPWVISDLAAKVDGNGHIVVEGRGLLIAGGNGVGTNVNASVFATLSCDAGGGTFTEHSTDPSGVRLDADGDFRIDDVLFPAPAGCASPALLIRNAANLTWFAAGIEKR